MPTSEWLSRDNRLVSYSSGFAKHQGTGCSDLVLKRYHEDCIEAVDGFAGLPAHCNECGKHLRGDFKEKRVTILIHDAEDDNRAVVYCSPCFKALGIDLETATDWRSRVSPKDIQIWELFEQGLKQGQIAARLTNQYQKVTQPQVSRSLERCRKARHKWDSLVNTKENDSSCIN